jgi:hypothetical protein
MVARAFSSLRVGRVGPGALRVGTGVAQRRVD